MPVNPSTLALDYAYAPRTGSPGAHELGQTLLSLMENRRKSAEAQALQDRTQAGHMALQTLAGSQAMERQLALADEQDLLRRSLATEAGNKQREAKYAEAATYGFKVDPEADPEVNEAKADMVLKKADLEAYKRMMAESEKISKERSDKFKALQEGAKIDPRVLATEFRSQASTLLSADAQKALSTPERKAAIDHGDIEGAINAAKLNPKDAGFAMTALGTATQNATRVAQQTWAEKEVLLKTEVDRADQLQRQIGDRMKSATAGWPARRFSEDPTAAKSKLFNAGAAQLSGAGDAGGPSPFDENHNPADALPAPRPMALPVGGGVPAGATASPPMALADMFAPTGFSPLTTMKVPTMPGGGYVPAFVNELGSGVESGANKLGLFYDLIRNLPSTAARGAIDTGSAAVAQLKNAIAPYLQAAFQGPTTNAIQYTPEQLARQAWLKQNPGYDFNAGALSPDNPMALPTQ